MEHSIVIIGTGGVAPGLAASFATVSGDVTIAGRGPSATASAAEAASGLAGAPIRAGAIDAGTLHGATLVVETIVEDLGEKQRLLQLIEPWISDETLVISNTSSLPLDEIAAGLRQQARFAGWHVIFPAHLTRVLEVVAGARTAPETMETLFELATMMGKHPILVHRATPGYVTNRIQMAVLRECLALVEEGVANADAVDAAVADGLAPRWLAAGPLGTADAGGIQTFQAVAKQLFPMLASSGEPQQLLLQATRERGLYDWTEDERAALPEIRRAALAHGADIAERRPRPRPTMRFSAIDEQALDRPEQAL